MSERDSQAPEPGPGPAPQPPGGQDPGEPVPRLPRGRGIKLSGPEIVRILMFLAMLIGVLALRQPCADGVSRFIGQFEVDAGAPGSPAPPKDAAVPGPADASGGYVRITGDMSEQEIRDKLGQAGVDVADAGPAGAARD